jgi:type II secretory pathway pseudopilin PulG
MNAHRKSTIRRRVRGVALPAIIFLVVIVSLLLAAGMAMLGQSQNSINLELQASRALAAASTATEWGAWQVSDPLATQGLDANTLPPCFAARALPLPMPLADLSVNVECTRYPAAGSVDEGGLKLAFYRVVATVDNGEAGTADGVKRTLEVRVSACKNPASPGPRYAC